MTKDKPAIAYTNVTADDWVTTDGPDTCADCLGHPRLCRRHEPRDTDAAALMDLVDQRAADDLETGADGGEL